jgi:hypothetical protein
MRPHLLIIFLLIGTPVFAQNSFTIQELMNIYEAQDKLKVIDAFKLKGYTLGSDDDKREMFADAANGVVYSRSTDTSKVGFRFDGDKIYELFFRDSIAETESLLPELEKIGFKLSNHPGEIKAYTKKKVNYFVGYGVMNEMAIIFIMRKTKATKMIYNPKR